MRILLTTANYLFVLHEEYIEDLVYEMRASP